MFTSRIKLIFEKVFETLKKYKNFANSFVLYFTLNITKSLSKEKFVEFYKKKHFSVEEPILVNKAATKKATNISK